MRPLPEVAEGMEQIEDLGPCGGVEIAGGFVEQKQSGPVPEHISSVKANLKLFREEQSSLMKLEISVHACKRHCCGFYKTVKLPELAAIPQ